MQVPSSWLTSIAGVVARAQRDMLRLGLTVVTIVEAVIPDPAPAAPPGLQQIAELMISWLKWIVFIGGVVGLLISAGMMVIGRRNRNALAVDGAASLPWTGAGLAIVGTAVGIVLLFI